MSILCRCREAAARYQVKKEGKNKGKWFFTCRTKGCNFFKWDLGSSNPVNTYVPNRHDQRYVVDPPYCQTHQISCVRRVSSSEKNPNRPYFSCPGDMKCIFHWEDEWISQNQHVQRKVSIDCQLSSPMTFVVCIPQCNYTKQIQDLLFGMKAQPRDGLYELPLNQMNNLIKMIKDNPILGEKVIVKSIPEKILNLVHRYPRINFDDLDRRINSTDIPVRIWKNAHPFQKHGIKFGIARNGKFLLADEMGLGKTLQAIAVSYFFRKDWPLLVVCPSSLKMNWANEFTKWIRRGRKLLSGDYINIIWSGKDNLYGKINIISYDLVVSMKKMIKEKNFQSIIVDETHYIKNFKAQRTEVIVPIIQNARRAIMITGTPALSRPVELYSQLSALFSTSLLGETRKRSDPWITKHSYIYRYCNAFDTGGWIDDKGASNLLELNVLLTNTIMIRRLKKDVLSQLPPKIRSALWVNIPKNALKDIKESSKKANFFKKKQKEQIQASHNAPMNFSKEDLKNASFKKGSMFMRNYMVTGVAKLPVLKQIIGQKLKDETQRFLIFGHHLQVLNGIEEIVKENKVDYIRIDGSTPPEKRSTRVDRFKRDPKCRVAILSITACGTGITLTPCSNVMFAELTWTPGALKQAEDRVHRIGQKSFVNIQYVLAKGTIDESLWGMIQNKLDVVGDALGDKSGVKDRETWETKLRASQSTPTFFKSNKAEEEDEMEEDEYFDDGGEIEDQDFEVEDVFKKVDGAKAENAYQIKEIMRKREIVKKKYMGSPDSSKKRRRNRNLPKDVYHNNEEKERCLTGGADSSEEEYINPSRLMPLIAIPKGNNLFQMSIFSLKKKGYYHTNPQPPTKLKRRDLKKKKKKKKKSSKSKKSKKKRKKRKRRSSYSDSSLSDSSSSSSSSSEEEEEEEKESVSSSDDEIIITKKKKKKKKKKKEGNLSQSSSHKKKKKKKKKKVKTPSIFSKKLTYCDGDEEDEDEDDDEDEEEEEIVVRVKKKKKKKIERKSWNDREKPSNYEQSIGKKRKRSDMEEDEDEEEEDDDDQGLMKSLFTPSHHPLQKKRKLDHFYGLNNGKQSTKENPNFVTPKGAKQQDESTSSSKKRRDSRRKSLQQIKLKKNMERRKREEEKRKLLEDISKDDIFANFAYTPPPNREKRKSATFF